MFALGIPMVTNVSIQKHPIAISVLYRGADEQSTWFADEKLKKKKCHVAGRNLYLSTDGLLFRERYVHPVGVLLPDDRDIVDIRGAKILRLRAPDDGDSIE